MSLHYSELKKLHDAVLVQRNAKVRAKELVEMILDQAKRSIEEIQVDQNGWHIPVTADLLLNHTRFIVDIKVLLEEYGWEYQYWKRGDIYIDGKALYYIVIKGLSE